MKRKGWKLGGKYLEKNFHIFPERFCSFKALNNIGNMHKDLILKAFEKAMAAELEMGVLSPSKSKAAELLSEYIDQELNFQFGERRLRDYFNAASKGEDIELKQKAVRNGLAKYIGYEDFRDFLLKNSETESETEKDPDHLKSKLNTSFSLVKFLKGNKTTLSIMVGCLLLFLMVNYANRQRWMVWQDDHYVETDFDTQKSEEGKMVVLNKETMVRFKQIEPDCDSQFFNSDGKVRVWYGKNQKGELEYFSDVGRHPETGKTLKPITQYMIDKYVCD